MFEDELMKYYNEGKEPQIYLRMEKRVKEMKDHAMAENKELFQRVFSSEEEKIRFIHYRSPIHVNEKAMRKMLKILDTGDMDTILYLVYRLERQELYKMIYGTLRDQHYIERRFSIQSRSTSQQIEERSIEPN